MQAARRSPVPLDITVVEPNAEMGRGLAYRGNDPDHRVNGPLFTHSIDPCDTEHIVRWAGRKALLDTDPQAACADGVFIRRGEYGRYLHEAVLEHAGANPSGSRITHRRARVIGLQVDRQRVEARLDDGKTLQAEASLLAIGNPPARLPAMLRQIVGHRALVTEPLIGGRMRELPSDEPVAVMGTSLTAADVLATLLRQGHEGPITAFSRRACARPGSVRPTRKRRPGWPRPG
ncbi:MAG: FAD/NAD(P)-binding protein [Burkholderiaceae bacterium]